MNGESIGRVTQAPYQLAWTPVALGQYTIEAIAYDAAGHQTQTPMVTVNAKEMGTGNLSCDIKQIYREDGTECMGDDHRAVSSVITPHGVLVKTVCQRTSPAICLGKTDPH